jgi:hypothetical protein
MSLDYDHVYLTRWNEDGYPVWETELHVFIVKFCEGPMITSSPAYKYTTTE